MRVESSFSPTVEGVSRYSSSKRYKNLFEKHTHGAVFIFQKYCLVQVNTESQWLNPNVTCSGLVLCCSIKNNNNVNKN